MFAVSVASTTGDSALNSFDTLGFFGPVSFADFFASDLGALAGGVCASSAPEQSAMATRRREMLAKFDTVHLWSAGGTQHRHQLIRGDPLLQLNYVLQHVECFGVL